MENRIYKVMSKNSNVPLKIAHGHFATNHSHVNYYIDMTTLKTRQSEAEAAAKALVPHYIANTVVDTILCLDGTSSTAHRLKIHPRLIFIPSPSFSWVKNSIS